jgi:alpha-L-arabinofuranosidase
MNGNRAFRYTLAVVLGLWLGTWGVTAFAKAKGPDTDALWKVFSSDRVTIEINEDTVVRESLPSTLFGFNINYRQFQNHLWDQRGQSVKPDIVEHLKYFRGALYRYPGGLVANSFDWTRSVGPVDKRKLQRTVYTERPDNVRFGPKEYLDFVDRVNGHRLYVLNLVGLDPMQPMAESDKEAVAKHNRELAEYLLARRPSRSGAPHYYQLGNELDRFKYEWSAQKYVDRARATMGAIQKVDRDARFIAFLRDFKWVYKAEPARGVSEPADFLREVLQALPAVTDYSLMHYYDGKRKDGKSADIPYWLKRMRATIAAYRATRNGNAPHIWITEHAREKSSNQPGKDDTQVLSSNLGGALSTADYLIAIAQIPEVQGACWHGLNGGPWQLFDATVKHRDLRPRPVYWGLRVLRAMDLPTVLATRTHSPNRSGYQGGYDVRAVGFRDPAKQSLGLWVVNRAAQPVRAEVEYRPLKGQEVQVLHYFLAGKEGVDPDDPGLEPVWQLAPAAATVHVSSTGQLSLDLPPASVSTFIIRAASKG